MIAAVTFEIDGTTYNYGTVYPHIVAPSRLDALVESISRTCEMIHGKAVWVLRCEKRAAPQEDPGRISP